MAKQEIEINIGWPTFKRLIAFSAVMGVLAVTFLLLVMTFLAPLSNRVT